MKRRIVVAAVAAVCAVTVEGGVFGFAAAAPAVVSPPGTPIQAIQRARLAFDKALPAMDGAHLVMKVADVRYGPGESSTPHRHNCAVVVFVIGGAVRMQVRGGPDSVYHRGETFHETPTDIHQVSANASNADSAHFTATFVCDHAGPMSVAVPDAHGGR